MLEKINLKDLKEVSEQLFKFAWDFKHADNIVYNFEVLRALYVARANTLNKNILNKPITIIIVSIVEAILIDFLTRIDQATTHLPKNVDQTTLDKIKEEIEKKKKPIKIEGAFGEQIYLRRKMYNFNEIIVILKKYELFGQKEDSIYKLLAQFGNMRNRVHIENYYQNFEKDENKVFTYQRLTKLEEVLSNLWEKLVTDYKRPWPTVIV